MTARLALALSLLMLAGCGSKPVASGVVPSQLKAQAKAERFFDAPVGAVWQYETQAHTVEDPYTLHPGVETVTVDAARRANGRTVLNLRAIDTYSNEYRFPVVTEDDRGVSIDGVVYLGAGAYAAPDLTIGFLKFPLVPNARWDDGQWIGKVLKREKVTVPAGTFDTWAISVIGTYEQAYTAVGTYWLAAGKGIVKSELSVPNWHIDAVLIPAGKPSLGAGGKR
jgi:hypothetical protein